MDGMGWLGLDGVLRVSLNFILRGYIDYVNIYLKVHNKEIHQHSYVFQNFISSLGVEILFSKTPSFCVFLF